MTHDSRTVSLYFARIDPANLLYAYVRSWFGPVHYLRARVPANWLKRFQPIHFEDALSSDEWIQLRDEAWAEWSGIVALVPLDRWKARLFGRTIDYHRIALQHLSLEYLTTRRLIRYIERIGLQGARIADGVTLRYLRRLRPIPGLEPDGKIGIDTKAWIWDFISSWGQNVGWAAYLALQALSAFRRSPHGPADLLHEGLSPSESGSGPDELSFRWICDRGLCSPERILFVLPSRPRRAAPGVLSRHGILVGLGWRTAWRAGWQGARIFVSGLLTALQPQSALLARLALRCIAPCLLVEGRAIHTYLTTNSACFPEQPSVALFNAMGIRTILWTYSSNMSLFTARYRSAERHLYTAHMETSECWLWSAHHQWLWKQGQVLPGPRFRVIGPAMMGSAAACLMPAAQARAVCLGVGASTPYRTVTVFDYTPVVKRSERARVLGPLVITLEWVDAFYQHLARLLEAYPDIRLIVKTKRHENPNKQKPPALKALVAPQSEWVRSRRIIYLDPGINPYIPIGAADLTIGLPFTSAVLAGLHFGRRGLYHDPLGAAVQHHYQDLKDIISHSYEELEEKVRYWLYGCSEDAFQTFLNRPQTRRFLGPRPGIDPAEEFGRALWEERNAHPGDLRDGSPGCVGREMLMEGV